MCWSKESRNGICSGREGSCCKERLRLPPRTALTRGRCSAHLRICIAAKHRFTFSERDCPILQPSLWESLYFSPKEKDELVPRTGLWIQGVFLQLLRSTGKEVVLKVADT